MFNDSFKDLINLMIEMTKLFINLLWTLIKTCIFWIWTFLPIIIAILIWFFSHPFKYKIIIILLLTIFNFVWAYILITADMNNRE